MKYDQSWASEAACRNYTQGRFFPEEGSRTEPWRWKRAVRVCSTCPVKRECLRYALEMERAGSIPLGMATFVKADWERDCKPTCRANCKDQKHWRKRSNDVKLLPGPFTASFTPPEGVWGGTTPPQRHALNIKHLVVVAGKCILGSKCKGCRPLDQWVGLLMGDDVAA